MGIFKNGALLAIAGLLLAASAEATSVSFTADPTSTFGLSINASVLGSASGSERSRARSPRT